MHYPTHHCATKKAFKDAIKAGKDIYLSDPSIFNPDGRYISDLPVGKMYYVCGPSERVHNWYANVVKGKDGKVKVS